MFSVKYTDEQRAAAYWFVLAHDIGQRGKADGTVAQQAVGMLGQIVVGDLLGKERPKGNGFDGGVDLMVNGKTVDVKTMSRKGDVKPSYVHNLIAYQVRYAPDYYIFTSLNGGAGELTVCGVISHADVIVKGDFYDINTERTRADGTTFTTKAPLYEIKQSDLYQVDDLEDLFRIIR